jgi:hypothetical protein
MKLTASQIYTLLLDGGFSEPDARIMTAIAQAESARDVSAVGDVALQTDKWGPSVGLFQIRTLRSETGTGGDRDITALTDNPVAQVRAAFNISSGGDNFRPWSTFTSGSYEKFLDTPLQAGVPVPAFAGAGAGAGQGPIQLAAAGADPFAIDGGLPPSNIKDTDKDGLTDQFEDLFGTDVNAADTDKDGLSDTFETATSHTDPLSVDTDKDGLTDDVEVARGTDAGQAVIPDAVRAAGFGGLDSLDSDKDGLSDGFEKRIGSDALKADSDGDSLSDAVEVSRNFNPVSVDTDNDGLSDAIDPQTDVPPPGGAGAGGIPGAGAGIPGAGGGIPGAGGAIPGSGSGIPGLAAAGTTGVPGGGAGGGADDDYLDGGQDA